MAIMMEKQLKSMDEMVKEATFVSKENAKKIMMKQVGEDAFEILDGVNPLPIHTCKSTADYVNLIVLQNLQNPSRKGTNIL